jgi:predicted PurR-regulated permease PerM
MPDTHLNSQKSEQNTRSPALHLVLFTALASAFASLVIAILSLSRRRHPAASSGFVEDLASDNSAIHPALQISSRGEEQALKDQYTSKKAVVPSEKNMTATPHSAEDVSAQYPEGQPEAGMPAPSYRWSLPTKYVVGVGLFLAFLYIVYISRSSLSMIIFAALLAFVVQPVIGFFRRRWNMKRSSAIGLAYLLVIALLILIPLILIPAVIQSLNGVLAVDWQSVGQDMAASLQTAAQNAATIPVIGHEISAALEELSQLLSGAARLPTPAPVVVDVSASAMGSQLGEMLGKLARVLGPLISAFVSLIFMLLISVRMSLATDEMLEAYPKLIPPVFKNEIIALVETIIKIWVSFLRGQLSLMVVMGFLVFLLNLVLGTPYPLFLGVLAGVLEIIPSLGPVLATIPAVILALVVGSSWLTVSNLAFAIILIAGYILLSGLENQVLVPKILGDAVELPPLVVIIGCVIGGAAFGLLGVFLATPVISTGKELFNYLYNKILEPPPEIKPPEEKLSLMSSLRGLTRRIRNPFRRREKEPAALQSPASTIEPATE